MFRHKEFNCHPGPGGGGEPASGPRPDTLPSPSPSPQTPANQVLPTLTQPCAWRISVGTCLHMWAPTDRVYAHMCRKLCSWEWQRLEAREACSGLSTLSSACPSLVHCLFMCEVLELEVKRKSHRDAPPQSCSERLLCGRAHSLALWSCVTECMTDCTSGFGGHLIFFFLTINIFFTVIFCVT